MTKLRHPILRDACDYLVYLGVRLIICVLQALPERGCYWFAHTLAWIGVDLFRIRQRVVLDNLTHAFPDKNAAERAEIQRAMWVHFGLLICEIAQAGRRIHETNWREHVRLANARPLVQLMLRSDPLVAVTAHFGNFEMCGYLAGMLGFPTYTVARPLDNRYLHDFLIQFRQSTGQYILPTKGSAPDAQRVMDRGGKLALLGDHYAGPKGCWVDYFQRPASCHKSIALLALANDCPLMVIETRRTTGFLKFEMAMAACHDPHQDSYGETVPEITQWYTGELERIVREAPGQYWWLHRRWKDPRPQRAKARARRAA